MNSFHMFDLGPPAHAKIALIPVDEFLRYATSNMLRSDLSALSTAMANERNQFRKPTFAERENADAG